MREKVNVYLPPELILRYQHEADSQGISLSALLAKRLAARDQLDELQEWMAGRFDRSDDIGAAIFERLDQTRSVDRLLVLVGLDRIEPELLAGSLSRVKEQFSSLTTKQREQLFAKGKELLSQNNGAHK
jgi:hypothetical protein